MNSLSPVSLAMANCHETSVQELDFHSPLRRGRVSPGSGELPLMWVSGRGCYVVVGGVSYKLDTNIIDI